MSSEGVHALRSYRDSGCAGGRRFWRLREKYVIRDFHPLVFFYTLGFLLTGLGIALGIFVAISRIVLGGDITTATATLIALLLISGSKFSLFAMWFDMESNKDLR